MKSNAAALLPWKRVDTALLPEPTNTLNHYDDTPSSQANKELEANPGETVAMFVGLEVIQGNEYTVNEQGKLQCIDSKSGETSGSEKKKQRKESSDAAATAKKRKVETEPEEEEEPPAAASTKDDTTEEPKKSKKKKRKKKKRKKTAKEEPSEGQQAVEETSTKTNDTTPDSSKVERMQTSWMMATGGVELHPTLCTSLLQQNFWTPTPIQSATLPAAIMGRRNVVGAAPTGSGKTLAYLLPILQTLLSQQDDALRSLQALILTPTRELALQVSKECDKLVGKKYCATIVGGLALQKQQRILEKNRPPILVATPGRLWDLVSL